MSRVRYPSLEDFLTATELTVDGRLDDGWGADVLVKGRELEIAVLFADIANFSGRTAEMSPTETLVFVNTFFAWITAEALRDGHGIVDKYIGDEVMVIFAREFGSQDPFLDAVRAARWICEQDVHDYGPHIGIAAGPAVVAHVGTPLRHNTSVFGASVATAARCAGVAAKEGYAGHCITFPSLLWTHGDVDDALEPNPRAGGPASETWQLTDAFSTPMKNLGDVPVQQLSDPLSLRIVSQTIEDRTRASVEWLERENRYWPNGRRAD